MATATPNEVVRGGSRLIIDPLDLSIASPYGGTELGIADRVFWRPGLGIIAHGREDDDAVQSHLYTGQRGILAAMMKQYDQDLVQTVFPNYRTSWPADDGVRVSPGQYLAARRVLVEPLVSGEPSALLLHRAVPLIEETEEVALSFIRTLTLPVIFEVQAFTGGEAFEGPGPLSSLTMGLLPTEITSGTLWGWWRADRGITKDSSDRTSAWNAINNPTRSWAQSTDANKPVFADAPTGGNNHPGLTFDKTAPQIMSVACTESNVPSLMIVVARSADPSASMAPVTQNDGWPTGTVRNQLLMQLGPDKLRWAVFGPANADSAAAWTNATTQILEGHTTASLASHFARINGTAGTEDTTSVSALDVTHLGLGSGASGVNPFDGTIFEVIYFSTPPTTLVELAGLRTYLTSRYGL